MTNSGDCFFLSFSFYQILNSPFTQFYKAKGQSRDLAIDATTADFEHAL